MVHKVKGFGIVNKAKVDVLLELSCFFHDPADVESNLLEFSHFEWWIDYDSGLSSSNCILFQSCIVLKNIRKYICVFLIIFKYKIVSFKLNESN